MADRSHASYAALDHVGLSVADLDGLAAWYQKALDLTVEAAFDIPGSGLSAIMLLHPSGFRLELLHHPDSAPGIEPDHPNTAARTRGYGHICLLIDDVPAAFHEMVGAGATSRVPPRPSFQRPGSTVAFVSDPEGNLIEMLDRPAR